MEIMSFFLSCFFSVNFFSPVLSFFTKYAFGIGVGGGEGDKGREEKTSSH